jgi:hypothetical protein
MLKIVAGATGSTRDFCIHEALLTARSKFFEKAMGKGWKEAEEKLVKLPEDDPDIFALYEQVIYTGRIPLVEVTGERVTKCGIPGVSCQVPNSCAQEYTSLSGLYVLAEKLQDMKTKNTAIKGITTKVTHEANTVKNNWGGGPCLPSREAITIMYEKTPRSCPGRQVLLDCFLYYA